MERPWWRLVRGEARWPEWGLGAGGTRAKGTVEGRRRRRECRRTDKKTNSTAAIGPERLYVQLSRAVLDSVNRSAYRRVSRVSRVSRVHRIQETGQNTGGGGESTRAQEYPETSAPTKKPPTPFFLGRYSIAPHQQQQQ